MITPLRIISINPSQPKQDVISACLDLLFDNEHQTVYYRIISVIDETVLSLIALYDTLKSRSDIPLELIWCIMDFVLDIDGIFIYTDNDYKSVMEYYKIQWISDLPRKTPIALIRCVSDKTIFELKNEHIACFSLEKITRQLIAIPLTWISYYYDSSCEILYINDCHGCPTPAMDFITTNILKCSCSEEDENNDEYNDDL